MRSERFDAKIACRLVPVRIGCLARRRGNGWRARADVGGVLCRLACSGLLSSCGDVGGGCEEMRAVGEYEES